MHQIYPKFSGIHVNAPNLSKILGYSCQCTKSIQNFRVSECQYPNFGYYDTSHEVWQRCHSNIKFAISSDAPPILMCDANALKTDLTAIIEFFLLKSHSIFIKPY